MRGDVFLIRDIVIANKLLYPIVIIVLTVILARTMLYLLEGLLKIFSKRSKTFNHKLISVIETPAILIVVLVGVELAVRNIIMYHENLGQLLLTGFIVILTYTLIRLGSIILDHWSTKMSHSKGEAFHSEVTPLLKSVTTLVLSILGVILCLQVWKVDIPTILTSLGVVSVLLGFAFQQTLGNIFGGISLIMDNSFRKGDLIQLDDNQIGEVMEINLRSTKIKNLESETIIIPNGKLSNSEIINLAQPTPTIRVTIPVSVAYGSDVDLVKQVLHDSLRNNPHILKMPKRFSRFIGFGDSALNFELYFYVKEYKKIWDIKDAALMQLYKDLYAHNIEVPFPIRTIVTAKPKQYDQKWKNPKNSPKKK